MRPRKVFGYSAATAVAIALLAAASGPAVAARAAEPVAAESRVTAVTVYPDRAVVTRRLEVGLPAGRSAVLVGGLLANLDERTLKCLPAPGVRGVKVADLSSDVHQPIEPRRADLAGLEKRREELELAVRAAEDGIVALHERARVLSELRELTARAMKRGLVAGQPKLDEWLKASRFISAQALAATAGVRDLEKRKFELNESLKEIKARAQAIANPSGPLVRRVRLAVDCRRAGRFALDLSYLVRGGVSWGPAYDVRLDRKASRAELTSMGAVSQETGEDWTDALLVFSTRSPARGLRAPEVEPMLLAALERGNRTSTLTSVEVKEDAPLEGPPPAGPGDRAPGMTPVRPGAPPGVGAVPGAAPAAEGGVPELRAGGEVVEFASRERVTVRSDGKPVLVPLGSWKSRCSWGLECIPKLLGSVYIRGSFANPTGAVLLAGPGDCYVDGAYIGKVRVPTSPAGSTLELSFGAVEGLSVAREARPLEGRRGRGYRYDYSIELANSGTEPAEVVVLEAIPVSTVKTVTVQLGEETSPCEKLDGGKLRWKVKLAPGERKQLRLSYRVDISRNYRY
jgi:uncharacterized protein (TIGR02231 family)